MYFAVSTCCGRVFPLVLFLVSISVFSCCALICSCRRCCSSFSCMSLRPIALHWILVSCFRPQRSHDFIFIPCLAVDVLYYPICWTCSVFVQFLWLAVGFLRPPRLRLVFQCPALCDGIGLMRWSPIASFLFLYSQSFAISRILRSSTREVRLSLGAEIWRSLYFSWEENACLIFLLVVCSSHLLPRILLEDFLRDR